MFNLTNFINKYVIERNTSMFQDDINNNVKELTQEIHNKSVLVIGGAGTIGSSFIRALLQFAPSSLVVVDINENGLTELTRDLRSSGKLVPPDYVTYPMNYADTVFQKMFTNRNGFDIVANFSAHKHVRSEKDVYSVQALIENNVIKARNLLELLKIHPPKHYFCVSTDKAANPVNVMGASKKIMEEMIMAYSQYFPVTTARFANVAFSNGSLPAGFLERLSKLQPISAPKDVTRYFVSPDESGQICMLACMLGKNREIYFPKLELKQVKTFSQIASQFLIENDYKPLECNSEQEALEKAEALISGDKNYPVVYFSSNTTGEKPYEEFVTDTETALMDKYESLGVITSVTARPICEIDQVFVLLQTAFDKADTAKNEIVTIIKDFLGNFDHEEKGNNLDSKM